MADYEGTRSVFPRGVVATIVTNQANIHPQTASGSTEATAARSTQPIAVRLASNMVCIFWKSVLVSLSLDTWYLWSFLTGMSLPFNYRHPESSITELPY